LSAAMHRNALPDRVMIVSHGATGEGNSNLPRDAVLAIGDTPGIKKGPDGKPLYSPQMQIAYITTKKSNGFDVFVCLRGVNQNLLSLRPEFKLVEGRMFTPGLRELIAGK